MLVGCRGEQGSVNRNGTAAGEGWLGSPDVAQESDREPGLIALARQGIHLVGWKGALQTATYGLRKARLDRRYLRNRPIGPEVRPGPTGRGRGAPTTSPVSRSARWSWRWPSSTRCCAGSPGRPVACPFGRRSTRPARPRSPSTSRRTTAGVVMTMRTAPRRGRLRRVGRGLLLTHGDDYAVVRRERPPVRVGERWTATVELEPDDQVHGLGERAAPFNLRPGTYGLWNTEQSGSYGPEADPLYITIPVHLVVAPGRAHLGFWENTHRGEVVIGDQLTATFEGGALRTYVSAGSPAATALERYRPPHGQRSELPPRWALGYHQCRWGYQTEARHPGGAGRVPGARPAAVGHPLRHRLHGPLPGLHGERGGLPRPRAGCWPISRRRASRGSRSSIPGWPRPRTSRSTGRATTKGHFLTLADGTEVNAMVWPGMVGFPDFSDPAVRQWWGDQYPKLLDQGVAGIWHDMCEPAVFAAGVDASLPLETRHDLEGRGGDHVEGRNLYGLGMAQAGHEALRRHRPDRRPWLLTRSGWAGVQRYAWTWTGDVATSWTMLHRTLCTTLNLTLSGVPYTGPTSAASPATRHRSSTPVGSRCRRGCPSSGPTRSTPSPPASPGRPPAPTSMRSARPWPGATACSRTSTRRRLRSVPAWRV